MNEEALNTLFELAKTDGYGKTFDEFKVLMSSNENAVNDMYVLSQKDGYTKPIEDFNVLVGLTQVTEPVVDPLKKKDSPEISQQDQAVVSELEGGTLDGLEAFPKDGLELSPEVVSDSGFRTEGIVEGSEKESLEENRRKAFEQFNKFTDVDKPVLERIDEELDVIDADQKIKIEKREKREREIEALYIPELAKRYGISEDQVKENLPKFALQSELEDPSGTFHATTTKLSDDVIAAYDAPFPDDSYKAGARIFPSLVPTSTDDPAAPANRKAWEVLMKWEKPFLTTFSDSDPVTAGGHKRWQSDVPGAQGQKHRILKGAGHFLQDDAGPELTAIIIEFMQDNPL